MKVLAILSEKGGAGKTSIAVNLAVAAEARGLPTVIFDLDPRANSTAWGTIRAGVPDVVAAQAAQLPALLAQARANGAALVILDTPGNAEGVAEKAAEAADALLIPCRPYGPDLISVASSAALARASGKPFFVVINAAPSLGVETAEAVTAIEAAGVAVAPVLLHSRKAFVSRFHEGLAALDVEPNGKAAAETLALLAWLGEQIGLVTK
jgi:chromosome partitioning protein